ncbi:MAG: hypothetical protein WBB82_04615, partial [Limnothrix sp.]
LRQGDRFGLGFAPVSQGHPVNREESVPWLNQNTVSLFYIGKFSMDYLKRSHGYGLGSLNPIIHLFSSPATVPCLGGESTILEWSHHCVFIAQIVQ